MMDSHAEDEHVAMDENERPGVIQKLKRLSNGTNERESPQQQTTPSSGLLENGAACNGSKEHGSESKDVKSTSSVLSENTSELDVTKGSDLPQTNDFKQSVGKSPKEDNIDCHSVCDSRTDKNCESVCASEDSQEAVDDGALNNAKSGLDGDEETSPVCHVDKVEGAAHDSDLEEMDTDKVEGATSDNDQEDMDTDRICVIASVTGDVSTEDVTFDDEDEKIDKNVSKVEPETKENVHNNRRRSKRASERENRNRLSKDRESSDVDSLNKNKEVFDQWGACSLSKKEGAENEDSPHDSIEGKHLQNSSKSKEAADSEKENIDKSDSKVVLAAKGSEGKCQKRQSTEVKHAGKQKNYSDVDGDGIEIIGESKKSHKKAPNNLAQTSKNAAFVSSGLPGASTSSSNLLASSSMLHGLSTGMPGMSPGFAFPGGVHGQGSQNLSLMVPTVAPPKPKSSLDQIELIRWEIQNRINTRPKYFKPNSSSELGPLAKFLFDIGSDLIKESVYHELVKIQSKKKGDDKLSTKEKEDLEKLKEIEKDLFATIGHLKLKLKQKCKVCNFHTESHNVMFNHKQYPHEDNKFLRCAHCSFSTKQAVTFKFHLEAEHAMQPKLHDKKAFYECDLCPYENNQEQKLILHKQRCLKQFRPLFNLHPSCLSGAEINLCLENIFYRPIIPKNLKFLQQKHAQQQAALAEARRQQAQMQVLAAQKNAAAVAAKKQQQQLHKRMPVPSPTPRAKAQQATRMPAPPKAAAVAAQARFSAPPVTKGATIPTVASMLNAKQNVVLPPPGAAGTTTASGFEVCEICGGYVKDRKALRIHFFYAHRIDLPFNLFERNQAPLYCATCYVRFWTAHGLRKHIDTHKEENQTRGVVGKCISCGHHVLNLLLHMRVVHNREMQHYINALMCMFCGSHFGSHQDCERHILKAHGHIDPTTGTLKSAPNAAAPPPSQQQPTPQKAAQNNKKPANNNLVKGSVCVLCNLNFGRNVDLTRHCMRMHHTCMKCGMVVIDKASLMKHTCLSSPSGTRDCTMCGEPGFHPAYYVKHLRDKHLKRFSIRVKKLDKSTIEQWLKRPYPFNEQEVLVEISDSDEDASKSKSMTPPAASPAKKPRIGPASKIGRSLEIQKKLVTSPPDVVDEEDHGVSANDDKKAGDEEDGVSANDENKDGVSANDENKDGVSANDENKDGVSANDENKDGVSANDENKDGVSANDEKEAVADEDQGVSASDAEDTSASAKEAMVTPENTSNVDESLSRESSPGQKRKSVTDLSESGDGLKIKK